MIQTFFKLKPQLTNFLQKVEINNQPINQLYIYNGSRRPITAPTFEDQRDQA